MDERNRRDGVAVENLGQYQPISEGSQFSINEEKVLEWLNKGAQPTATIAKLLKKTGVWKRFKKVQ